MKNVLDIPDKKYEKLNQDEIKKLHENLQALLTDFPTEEKMSENVLSVLQKFSLANNLLWSPKIDTTIFILGNFFRRQNPGHCWETASACFDFVTKNAGNEELQNKACFYAYELYAHVALREKSQEKINAIIEACNILFQNNSLPICEKIDATMSQLGAFFRRPDGGDSPKIAIDCFVTVSEISKDQTIQADAFYNLGEIYAKISVEESMHNFKNAVMKGHTTAAIALQTIVLENLATLKAIPHSKTISKLKKIEAHYRLSIKFYLGTIIGSQKDYQEAVSQFEAAECLIENNDPSILISALNNETLSKQQLNELVIFFIKQKNFSATKWCYEKIIKENIQSPTQKTNQENAHLYYKLSILALLGLGGIPNEKEAINYLIQAESFAGEDNTTILIEILGKELLSNEQLKKLAQFFIRQQLSPATIQCYKIMTTLSTASDTEKAEANYQLGIMSYLGLGGMEKKDAAGLEYFERAAALVGKNDVTILASVLNDASLTSEQFAQLARSFIQYNQIDLLARYYLLQNQFLAAIQCYEKIIAATSDKISANDKAVANYALGIIFSFGLGGATVDISKATQYFNTAAKGETTSLKNTLHNALLSDKQCKELAEFFLRRKTPDAAIEYYIELEKVPIDERTGICYKLMMLFILEGNSIQAIACSEAAEALARENAYGILAPLLSTELFRTESLQKLAAFFAGQKNFSAAIACYTNITTSKASTDQQKGTAYLQIGRIHYRHLNNLRIALLHFEAAAALGETNAKHFIALTTEEINTEIALTAKESNTEQKNFFDVIASHKKTITSAETKESEEAEALLEIGRIYYQNLKKFDVALMYFEEAEKLKEPRAQTYIDLIAQEKALEKQKEESYTLKKRPSSDKSGNIRQNSLPPPKERPFSDKGSLQFTLLSPPPKNQQTNASQDQKQNPSNEGSNSQKLQ